ncbi:MAG: cytochrome b/b6 domain-containing protein [Pararhizobium sp.]
MATDVEARAGAGEATRGRLIYRQSAWTRVTHWLWAICIFFLLLSGLNIFNAHPSLYIGQQSGFGGGFDNSILDIHAERTGNGAVVGVTDVFGHRFETTGALGVSGSADDPQVRAFPAWATIPSYYDLATGRVVHFFFAWVLVGTMIVWFVASFANGHFRRDILPRPRDIRKLPRDVIDHLRLRFDHGGSYNVLQKLSYGGMLIIVLPLIILTGLTMSPGVDAFCPWLLDVFGGRQTARTIHFICMSLVVLFFVVHIVMVLLAGPFNELRSIITGWYRADAGEGGKES